MEVIEDVLRSRTRDILHRRRWVATSTSSVPKRSPRVSVRRLAVALLRRCLVGEILCGACAYASAAVYRIACKPAWTFGSNNRRTRHHEN